MHSVHLGGIAKPFENILQDFTYLKIFFLTNLRSSIYQNHPVVHQKTSYRIHSQSVIALHMMISAQPMRNIFQTLNLKMILIQMKVSLVFLACQKLD